MPLPALSPAELEARLRLHALPELGSRRFRTLIEAFASASAALTAPAAAWRALGLRSSSAEARRTPEVRDSASAVLRWLEHPDHHLLMWDSAAYPGLLGEIADAPPLLFVEGALEPLERPQLAIVGSRRASRPGLDTAQAFARSLAEAGFVITSGLALGIDGAAHQGALQAQAPTVAVLGTGLQRIYPARHVPLSRRIVEGGGSLVSEYPLDCAPQASNFPRSNRLISGLSLGVLVVEASPSSGSLITARLAAEQNREVYAIPGSIHHPGARGCHELIRQGATLVEQVDDILQGLRGWTAPAPQPSSPLLPPSRRHPLLDLLRAAPMSSEALAQHSGLAVPEVLASLTELELDGHVACEAGVWVHRSG
ncbi:MAG: DNA processing protein DprA [Stenotrophomonas maltophilia]|nr:MAG: DNA processing protein DprA [Stenotrophomonas maltophilia]